MPAERLKFEHQKCQQQIRLLEMKQIALRREYDNIQEIREEGGRHLHSKSDWDNYNPPDTNGVEREMSSVESEEISMKAKIAAIEKALESKW